MSEPPKRKSRTRRYAKRAWIWGFEAVALVLLLILSGIGFSAWRLSQGPIDLAFAKPQIEGALTRARGAPIDIGSLVLEWSGDRKRVELTARELTLSELEQQGAITPSALRIEIETWPLLVGRVEARRIRVEGGQIYATRLDSGVWRFGLGEWQPSFADQTLEVGTFSLNDLRALFEDAFGARLTDVSIEAAVLNVRPTLDSAPEQVAVEGMRLLREDGRLNLTGRFRIPDPHADGTEGAQTYHVATVSVDAPEALDTALIEIAAPAFPLKRLALYEPQLDAFLPTGKTDILATLQISEAFGLERLDVAVSQTALTWPMADNWGDITGFDAEISADLVNRQLDVARLVLSSERVGLEMSGQIENIDLIWAPGPDPGRRIGLSVSIPRYRVDLRPVFEAPWQGEDVSLEALFDPVTRRLEIESLSLLAAGANLTARGALKWAEDQTGLVPFGVTLSAGAKGRVPVAEVLRYWPVEMATSSRVWIRDNVSGGYSPGGQIRLQISPEAFARKRLLDEEMTLDFGFADAAVRVVSDLPAIVGASGTGRMRGNSLSLQMRTGRMGQWTLKDASMNVPYMFPEGAIGVIEARASGPVGNLIRMLDESSLQVAKRYGLEYADIEGVGDIDMRFLRPMKPRVEIEEIGMLFDGQFENVRLPNVIDGIDLTAQSAGFRLEDQRLKLTGEGQFGPVALNFAWNEVLEEGGLAQLDASFDMTPDLLNRLGYRVRQFLTGNGSVKLTATGKDGSLDRFEARTDLTQMAIDLPEIGYNKPAGKSANGVFIVTQATPPNGHSYALTFNGGGLDADLAVLTLAEGGVRRIDLKRFVLDDRADVKGEVVRSGAGFEAVLSGSRLDLSPLLRSIFRSNPQGEKRSGDEQEGVKRAPLVPFPITLDARLDTLKLGQNQTLTSATIAIDAKPSGLGATQIEGQLPDAGQFRLDLSAPTSSGSQVLSLYSDDAGFVMSSLFGPDTVKAGRLSAEGDLTARSQGGYRGQIVLTLDDVTLVRAPVLAQVLSLASLEGLTSVLSGGGVTFTSLDVPISIDGGKLGLREARANGPALGITVNGMIDLDARTLNLDGVLVPSYGINSVLGNVPVLGELFVGRKGEGVIGFTYSIKGELAAALVTVNPLSAVTPGIFRRIFEPARPDPSVLPDPIKPAE